VYRAKRPRKKKRDEKNNRDYTSLESRLPSQSTLPWLATEKPALPRNIKEIVAEETPRTTAGIRGGGEESHEKPLEGSTQKVDGCPNTFWLPVKGSAKI